MMTTLFMLLMYNVIPYTMYIRSVLYIFLTRNVLIVSIIYIT